MKIELPISILLIIVLLTFSIILSFAWITNEYLEKNTFAKYQIDEISDLQRGF